jgi:S-formylglutathione hydrolase FrmB
MAVTQVNFASDTLHHDATYWAVVPVENRERPLRTLYLLHGIGGDETQWLFRSRIVSVAEAHGVAVVMPAGGHSFYVDRPSAFEWVGEYIGRELVAHSRSLFPLSTAREDTWIGGLSMGGYGAIRNGLKYHDTFGAVAALSSALVSYWASDAPEEAEWPFARRAYVTSVFGDPAGLVGSENDVEALAERFRGSAGQAPRLYLTCGTEDSLVAVNRRYRDHLTKVGIDHTYVEGPGQHDWTFWDSAIVDALKWLEA